MSKKSTKTKKTIKFEDLVHHKHLKMMDKMGDESVLGFSKIISAIFKDIKKVFKAEKLSKSDNPDDKKLAPGWTGDVPQISVDVSELLSETIERHLQALRWIMIGDFAGKDAKAAAKALGLEKIVTPGVLHATYLDSIDTEREHFEDVTDTRAPKLPEELIQGSMEKINRRAERGLDLAIAQIKHNILENVDQAIEEVNNKNVNNVHKMAHDIISDENSDSTELDAANSVDPILPIRKLDKKLKEAVEGLDRKWKLITVSETTLSSSVGAHQAMTEVYGAEDDRIKVAWITLRNERVCNFCETASRNDRGQYKYYKISSFKPSGYNYGKKKSEWKLVIPPAHPNCECRLVYLMPGFMVDETGNIVQKNK